MDITTFDVDVKEMSKKAVHILIKKIEDDRYKQGITIVDGHVVYKNSVRNIGN